MIAPERIWVTGIDDQPGPREAYTSLGSWPGRTEYIAATKVQELIRAAVEAERERLQSDRPFIMGANHGYDTAMDQVVDEARRFAEMYPQSSDGRNTFEIFADWARRMKDGPAFDPAMSLCELARDVKGEG